MSMIVAAQKQVPHSIRVLFDIQVLCSFIGYVKSCTDQYNNCLHKKKWKQKCSYKYVQNTSGQSMLLDNSSGPTDVLFRTSHSMALRYISTSNPCMKIIAICNNDCALSRLTVSLSKGHCDIKSDRSALDARMENVLATLPVTIFFNFG